MKYTQAHLKRHPEKRMLFTGKKVVVWSASKKKYIGGKRQFTVELAQATVYDFSRAWAIFGSYPHEERLHYIVKEERSRDVQ